MESSSESDGSAESNPDESRLAGTLIWRQWQRPDFHLPATDERFGSQQRAVGTALIPSFIHDTHFVAYG
jgi:hypothetical protein